MVTLRGKDIVVGVTGSIAAYKAAQLVRHLRKEGATVKVVMTAHATRFVTPLTFETLSGNRVIWDMFSLSGTSVDHVSLGQGSTLIVIAPATANFLAKIAHGLGDDFLSTLILAATAKILICPAMDKEMFSNSVVQANIHSLRDRGFVVMEPEEGTLVTGAVGLGRFPDPLAILEQIRLLLTDHDLEGLKVLVTAGPTVEYIDPVRIVTNRSSGKMGYALARAAWRRGAEVTLIAGPTHLNPPQGVAIIQVSTAEEMRHAVLGNYRDKDLVIKAAAVSDYRPLKRAREKEKKKSSPIALEMVPTPDILAELGKNKGCITLVGFAAETTDHITNAKNKMKEKNLDLIVVNDVSGEDTGFAADSNEGRMIDREGNEDAIPLMSKDDVADRILDKVRGLRAG
jgi:phosphopantothenoylcysteine decarboxylase/phosphopantothenate--cysteine ligase